MLTHFSSKIFQYDLINKFWYKKVNKIPKLKKIILSFNCKKADNHRLASALLALELISSQKSSISIAKKVNLSLKIKKGNPIGCKVTLKKVNAYQFLSELTENILPRLKNFTGFRQQIHGLKDNLSYQIADNFTFTEIEKKYYLFNNLPVLNITFVTNSKSYKEMVFLLKSLKLPIKVQI